MPVKPGAKYAIVTLEVAIPVDNIDPAHLTDWCTDSINEALCAVPTFDEWHIRKVWGPLGTPSDGQVSPGDIFFAAGVFKDTESKQ